MIRAKDPHINLLHKLIKCSWISSPEIVKLQAQLHMFMAMHAHSNSYAFQVFGLLACGTPSRCGVVKGQDTNTSLHTTLNLWVGIKIQ